MYGWNRHKDEELRRLINDGRKLSDIARGMGASVNSVKGRMETLGLQLQTSLAGQQRTHPKGNHKEFLRLLEKHHGEKARKNAETLDDGWL